PVGINGPDEPEPPQPAWCLPVPPLQVQTGALDALGGFVDKFNNNGQLGRLLDGDYGYHVYEGIQDPSLSAHFLDHNHFMADLAKQGGMQGTAISPRHPFFFENGKLVIEADVNAGVGGFHDSNNGDIAWAEVAISTSPAPTGITDGLYLYGHFQGFTT